VWKYPTLLSALFLAAVSVSAQDAQKPAQAGTPADNSIPAEALKQANPVKPTAESIARGKKQYGYDCAMCHGADGSGKGEIADLKTKLPDYRDPKSLQDKTDGELFYVIKNGKGEMPSEGDREKAEQIWDMVNYVRSFAKKEPPPKPKDQTP
jgi:mono/diheme cytochrome c family protein